MLKFSSYIYLLALASISSLSASPKGGKVKAGDAQIIQEASTTTIRSSKDSIIHWDQFSIDKGELVHFSQKSHKDAVLNRVTGSDKSLIYGDLTSNGKIFLINPQGLLIGPSGRIESAGFFGSTLDLIDSDFLNGKDLLFQNPGPGTVTNLGSINCPMGEITLIARSIKNVGSLTAEEGSISLASGVEVLLHVNGDRRIAIRPDLSLPNAGNELAIENLGEIRALSVELQSCKNPYAKAIRSTGDVAALGVKTENGRVLLVADKGTTTIEGTITAPSGQVHLLGEEVHVKDGALIDVSGDNGAGEVLIGGDYQGKNPDVPNAKKVIIEKGAIIKADALQNGDGGKIITWGDETNHFYGEASARGGQESGDGGLVEVSADTNDWIYKGTVNTLAPNGKAGELLFDPSDITISTGATTDPFDPPTTYNPAGVASAVLNDVDLGTALATSSITIATSAGVGGLGDVIFDATASVIWAASTTLTVNADRNVTVSGTVFSSATGGYPFGVPAISLNANVGGSVTSGGDGITISSTGVLIADGGDINLNGTSGFSSDGVHISGPIFIANAAGCSVEGTSQSTLAGVHSGIRIDGAGQIVSSGSGPISLTGTGQTGIYLPSTAFPSVATPGAIAITGTSTGLTDDSIGVRIDTPASVLGGSNITVTGTGGLGELAVGCHGVLLEGASAEVGTSSVSTVVTGTGGGSGSNNTGVSVLSGATLSSGPGSSTITVTGTGSSSGTTGCHGVLISGASATVVTDAGMLTVSGVGGGSSADNTGVRIDSSGSIASISTGELIVDGQGGGGSGSSFGLLVTGTGSEITSDGAVSAIGRQSSGNGLGVSVTDSGSISSPLSTVDVEAFGDLLINTNGVATSTDTIVTASRDILLSGGTIASTAGDTTVTVNRSLSLASSSSISATGALNIIIDNAFPTSPSFGSGALTKDAASTITSSGGAVRVFTATQEQNSISGDINGTAFVAGTEFINTATEIWGVYAPSSLGGTPFTIFYKNGETLSLAEATFLEQTVAQASIDTAQEVGNFGLGTFNYSQGILEIEPGGVVYLKREETVTLVQGEGTVEAPVGPAKQLTPTVQDKKVDRERDEEDKRDVDAEKEAEANNTESLDKPMAGSLTAPDQGATQPTANTQPHEKSNSKTKASQRTIKRRAGRRKI